MMMQRAPPQHWLLLVHGSPAERQQAPLWQVCAPEQQLLLPQQVSNCEQQVEPQGAVPFGHSHEQVLVFKTFGGVHAATHWPPQATVPGGHGAQVEVAGSQNLLQHSRLSRHCWPSFLHRPTAPALPTPSSDSTLAPPAAAKSRSA
jgi:hypothetical protein